MSKALSPVVPDSRTTGTRFWITGVEEMGRRSCVFSIRDELRWCDRRHGGARRGGRDRLDDTTRAIAL